MSRTNKGTGKEKPKIYSLTVGVILLTASICSFVLSMLYGFPDGHSLPTWVLQYILHPIWYYGLFVVLVFGIVGFIKAIKTKASIDKLLLGIFLITAGGLWIIWVAFVKMVR